MPLGDAMMRAGIAETELRRREARTLVYDALNNAWEGEYSLFIIDNTTDVIAADLAANVDGIEKIHPDLIRENVLAWKTDKAKEVGEF